MGHTGFGCYWWFSLLFPALVIRHVRELLYKIILLSLCLSACAPKTYAPVEVRSVKTQRQQIQQYGGHLVRFVKPGDTLYGIAFESNLSIKKLAAWNDIDNYRNLRIGQRLRLTRPVGFVEKKVVVKSSPKVKKPALASTKKTVIKSSRKPTVKVKQTPEVKRPAVVKKSPTSSSLNRSWVWPVKGSVLRTFSPKHGRQGIDIAVLRGKAVLASRQGEVVYVGSSLKGYGKLIIIQHDGDFLSAYAHNAKILVKEGQKVNAKQKIGVTGLNNRGEQALQFQIRIDGNSVNPLPYLKG